MTEEQKELLIARMLDAPSSLSNEELDAIIHDPELSDLYEISAKVSGACVRQTEVNMTEEWKRFSPRLKHKPMPVRWIMRAAAILLGVTLLPALAVYLIDRDLTKEQPHTIAKIEPPAKTQKEHPAKPVTPVTEVANEDAVALPVKQAKTVTPSRSSVESKVAETTTHDEIDIDEYLRIEQARINNDLAMINAEVYKAEFKELLPLLEAIGAHNADIDKNLYNITML